MSERYTISRISLGGENFEILVNPEAAHSYRTGKEVSLSEILVTETVYTDAKKGMRASEEKLKKAFGTLNIQKIASQILKRGTLLLTAEQRRKMIEEKRRQIIAFIVRNCVDPRTKLPHPPLRIEQAMEQVHASIDPFKSVEEQANDVIKLLRSILPLSMERVTVSVRIPPQYTGKVYGMVRGFGALKREEWHPDGSWSGVIEMPAGLYGPFLEKLGEATKGNLEAKLID
ncbi:MAG: ribosome assembly factor SBDS [Candidatus Bathyarchaeia archaeon]